MYTIKTGIGKITSTATQSEIIDFLHHNYMTDRTKLYKLIRDERKAGNAWTAYRSKATGKIIMVYLQIGHMYAGITTPEEWKNKIDAEI